jgi:divalent metal cation (Fe/Co/Zn/Cd) transporter
LTSLVALAAIAAGQIYPFLDPVGGCLVSLLIIRVGYQSGRGACQEIVDRGLEPEIIEDLRHGAENGLLNAGKEAIGEVDVSGAVLGKVIGTKSGAYYIVDVDVEGPKGMTIEAFERIQKGVVEGVQRGVKAAKIVRVFVKTKDGKGNGTVS